MEERLGKLFLWVLNVAELATVCDISRTTVYKYIGLLEA